MWSMKIGDTDVFQEAKEHFIHQYNSGIKIEQIISEMKNEISNTEDLGERHELLFALAECLWLCKQQDSDVMKTLFKIMRNKENIKYLAALGTSPNDLRLREMELRKFIDKLQRPCKQILYSSKKIQLKLKKGDIFLYKWKYIKTGCGIVLDVLMAEDIKYWLVALSLGETISESVEDVLECWVQSISWFTEDSLLPSSKYSVIGNIKISNQYNGRAGLFHSEDIFYCSNVGRRSLFLLKDRLLYIPDTKLKELLDSKRLPKTRII